MHSRSIGQLLGQELWEIGRPTAQQMNAPAEISLLLSLFTTVEFSSPTLI